MIMAGQETQERGKFYDQQLADFDLREHQKINYPKIVGWVRMVVRNPP